MADAGSFRQQLPGYCGVPRKTSTCIVIDALTLKRVNMGIRGASVLGGLKTTRSGALRRSSPARRAPIAPKLTSTDSPAISVLMIDGKGVNAHITRDNQGECNKRKGLASMVVYRHNEKFG